MMQDIQEQMYKEFHKIQEESQAAFEYAKNNYEELINRPVAHILYGAREYGPGAVFPSQRLTRDRARALTEKNRRKSYLAYYFDSNWDVLYSRNYNNGKLECTMLHFFIGDTNYARYFLEETNMFYTGTVFSAKYENRKPVRCAITERWRVYVEYLKDTCDIAGNALIEYSWYDYYPTKIMTEKGIPISRSAPFGSPNSPVLCGKEYFKPLNIDFGENLFLK